MKVDRIGPKAFLQCAGFLRIPDGGEILDNTGVHPESYKAARALLKTLGYTECDVANRAVGDIKAVSYTHLGPLDEKRGVIMSPPNLPGWDDVEIKKFLENKYHVSVSVRNDANACALAEWKFGAARGYSNVVFLTFGTGMGAGLILDGLSLIHI